ncbi:hypothetical protein GO755_26650 [Spirosoma sp. HMF4905]|uniref:Uncharacterized protein n=1 Tax=Spirosoma arboris TaxID=2682092 RepID=A0A7K1SIK7_9BACT|nr:hypothetical protein [Spirosoma arboris]MVM33647.1 hypothetical protein [Spirosoma arboris]
MNDSGLLKELLDSYNKQASLLWTVGAFVIVNIIVGIINLIAQYNIKKLDITVHKTNLQETKRLDLMNDLYKRMDSLRNIFNDNPTLQAELQSTFQFLSENGFYLKNGEMKVARECCDYFSTLLISQANKDIAKEKLFLENFKKEFIK